MTGQMEVGVTVSSLSLPRSEVPWFKTHSHPSDGDVIGLSPDVNTQIRFIHITKKQYIHTTPLTA